MQRTKALLQIENILILLMLPGRERQRERQREMGAKGEKRRIKAGEETEGARHAPTPPPTPPCL